MAWSPDAQTLAIATLSTAQAGYNGNPNRNDDDETVLSADAGEQVLWRVAAPRPIDDGARAVTTATPAAGRWTGQFDRVWHTMKSLYYRDGESATAWDAAARQVSAAGDGGEDRAGRRGCRRRADRGTAAHEARGRIARGA